MGKVRVFGSLAFGMMLVSLTLYLFEVASINGALLVMGAAIVCAILSHLE